MVVMLMVLDGGRWLMVMVEWLMMVTVADDGDGCWWR